MPFRLHDPDTLAADFEQVIVPVICFLFICLLTRYWFVSCQQCICHRLSPLHLRCVGCFEQVIVPVLLCLELLVKLMSAALVHWGYLAV